MGINVINNMYILCKISFYRISCMLYVLQIFLGFIQEFNDNIINLI